ncbi:MAG: alpha2 protein [Huanggang Rhabd tick virus 2]|uniref:Alpha2 protein n=1 Tax=Huanggang Rhabd tick virus 2 TaxID=2972329 RepID=A0A9E7V2A5_9RHAB|nr:MAG: alpha2 protein [Huanggang Rhabd tick virus 2]
MIVGEILIENIKLRKTSTSNRCHKIEIWSSIEDLLTDLSKSRNFDKGLIDEIKTALSRKVNQMSNWVCAEDVIKVDFYYIEYSKKAHIMDYFETKKSVRPKFHTLGSLDRLDVTLYWAKI